MTEFPIVCVCVCVCVCVGGGGGGGGGGGAPPPPLHHWNMKHPSMKWFLEKAQ